MLPQLKKGDEVQRAYLGVRWPPVTDQIADDLNLPVKRGALIQSVVEGGPADDAGLRGGRTPTGEGIAAGGDLIVKVDGKTIKDPDDVADAIAEQEARRRGGGRVLPRRRQAQRRREARASAPRRCSRSSDTPQLP